MRDPVERTPTSVKLSALVLGAGLSVAWPVVPPAWSDTHDDGIVIFIVAGESGFEDAALHLPAEGTAIDSGGIVVEGLLVGFVGDFVPFSADRHAVRVSETEVECHGESYFFTLDIGPDAPTVVDKEFRSGCRAVVSWADPEITLVNGAEDYFRMELTRPETRAEQRGLVAPAMWEEPVFVRLTLTSDPPGSQIYINDELMPFQTDTRIGVPYQKSNETEKRYLIRQPGLVNCYGIVQLPAEQATVDCVHRFVR